MKRAIWLLMAVGWLTAVPAFSQQAQTEKPGAITERTAAQNREQKAQLAAPSVLTNKDVLEMLKVGLPAEVVVAKIRSSTCNFDTSPATLAKLKADGAPDSVILAMVQVSAAPQEPRSVEAAKTGQRVQQYESSDTTACKVYFSVVLLDDRVPGGIAWGMDERQRRWYQTEGRKKYPVVCYVLDPQDARVSYVVAWSTEHEVTRPTGIFVDVSPGGGGGFVGGMMEGYAKTLNQIPQRRDTAYVSVWRVRTDGSGRRAVDESAAVYSSERHVGSGLLWRATIHPTRRALEDAVKFLATPGSSQ